MDLCPGPKKKIPWSPHHGAPDSICSKTEERGKYVVGIRSVRPGEERRTDTASSRL
jgi:hypothetical protein